MAYAQNAPSCDYLTQEKKYLSPPKDTEYVC